MYKLAIISAMIAVCCFSAVSAAGSTCSKNSAFFKKGESDYIEFSDMKEGCVERTRGQINTEIKASMSYLAMAVHFAKDSVNRPGFAKFFFEAASEERGHAYKLIEYLSMRGEYLNSHLENAFSVTDIVKTTKDITKLSGIEALKIALGMEKDVTKSIRELIAKCESDDNMNHYHFVDYLTSEFLEEQYKGQRDIAGKISTLGKMVAQGQAAEMAEFLFDKQLL